MDGPGKRTALVTGASRGIGRGIARRLSREGVLVAVHYSNGHDAARETVALIEKEGGQAFPVHADFEAPESLPELMGALASGLEERTGTAGLDILVNNAAITAQNVEPEEVTPELFDRYLQVNAKAPFFLVQRALRFMRDGGRIINISSGLTRTALPKQMTYAMSKAAIEQLTLHMARHVAPRGITVNTVAPGITNSGGPLFAIPEAVKQMSRASAFNRLGEVEDIADVVAFLASADARWITGAFIDASGGSLLGWAQGRERETAGP